MLKKILTTGILSALVSNTLFANTSNNINLNSYIKYTDYSKVFNNKKTIGINSKMQVKGNDLFTNLEYTHFDTNSKDYFKWDLTLDYSIINTTLPFSIDIGGKLTEYHFNSKYNPGYSIFAGIANKNYDEIFKSKFGIKVYYTNLKHLIANQKAAQIDFDAIAKPTKTEIGTIYLKNTLSYIRLKQDNFDNKKVYISDEINANIKNGPIEYLTGVHFGKAAFKINSNDNYSMDMSGSVDKWGLSGGIKYKIAKNSAVIGKINYSKINTSFENNVNKITYTLCYNTNF